MTGRIRISAALCWGLLFLLAAAMACGVKKPPLPAGQLLPARPPDVKYTLGDGGLLRITFERPSKNVRGEPLGELGGFWIQRSENLATPGFCPGCPVRFGRRFRVRAQAPPPGRKFSDRPYVFQDTLRSGYVYKYRLFAYDKSENYDPGQFVELTIHYGLPAIAPEGFLASVEDRLVHLNWAPADRTAEGASIADLAGYQIERLAPGEDWRGLIAAESWPHASFEDDRVENGKTYEYRVRALRNIQGTLVAGPWSRTVEATPLDLTPPPPPVKVDAVSTVHGIRLHWPEVEASDLAGYRVYRRGPESDRFSPIGPGLITENIFLDDSVQSGKTYEYGVTSVDASPAANESGPSRSGTVVHEP